MYMYLQTYTTTKVQTPIWQEASARTRTSQNGIPVIKACSFGSIEYSND